MKIFSDGFHTSYQYNLATAFPEHEWTFTGPWSPNRPLCGNVSLSQTRELADYDFYLAHSPAGFIDLACRLDLLGIDRSRIVYITHWGKQSDQWRHVYNGVDFDSFLRDVSRSPIVCVSHYMAPQFAFYSDVIVSVIPHFIPSELFDENIWLRGSRESYINVVNSFYQPGRGVGSEFWDGLPLPKTLYGANNRATDGGSLATVSDLKAALSRAKGYLWTADAVATSFAPLEAMALGCPVIAPDNLDWRIEFEPGREVLLYEPGNQASCLEQIARFESDADLRTSLSVAGRNAVLERFRKELFRDRWQRLFDAALKATDPSGSRDDYVLRRGSGTMAAGDGRLDLVTELRCKQVSACVVHPQFDNINIRQSLRSTSNVLNLQQAFLNISDQIIKDSSFVGVCSNYGATTQLLLNKVRSANVCAGKDYIEFERSSELFNSKIYYDRGKKAVEFFDIGDVDVYGINLERKEHFVEFLSRCQGPFFISYEGLEPAIVVNLLDWGVRPDEIVANCLPHESWAKGCHVEIMVERLGQAGYRVQYLDIPNLNDLSANIAPGDTIPKSHRYVIRASLDLSQRGD